MSVLLFSLHRLAADQRGSTLPLAAAGMILALAGAAVGVDLTRAYALQAELRTTADAAALAAAARLPDVAAARKAALAYAEKNMPRDKFGEVLTREDIAFGEWDPSTQRVVESNGGASAVQVTVRMSQQDGNAMSTFLAGMFGTDAIELSARATAGRRSPTCVLALEPSESRTLRLDSNASLEAENCTVQVNSNRSSALSVQSNGSIAATAVCVAGDSDIGSSAVVSPDPVDSCPPSPDPLAGLEPPDSSGCDYNNARYVDATGALHPGVYCGGLEIDGNSDVHLSAGTYVIKDGPLAVLSNSVVTGHNVSIYLTGDDATLFFDSNSEVSLVAPESGPLEGIMIFQDRAYSGVHRWNSSEAVDLHGTIYLPQGDLESESLSAITPLSSCSVIIARTIEFDSNSGVSIDLNDSRCLRSLPKALRGAVVLFE